MLSLEREVQLFQLRTYNNNKVNNLFLLSVIVVTFYPHGSTSITEATQHSLEATMITVPQFNGSRCQFCCTIHNTHCNKKSFHVYCLQLNLGVFNGVLRTDYTVCPTHYRTRLAGGPLLRVATIRRTTDTHYRHIPFHFSHNERTRVQISLQYLHWC